MLLRNFGSLKNSVTLSRAAALRPCESFMYSLSHSSDISSGDEISLCSAQTLKKSPLREIFSLCAREDASLSHPWETHGFPNTSFTGDQMFSRPLSLFDSSRKI